jgi:hypothetical protein
MVCPATTRLARRPESRYSGGESFSRGHDHERDDDPAYLRVGTFADSEDPRAAG